MIILPGLASFEKEMKKGLQMTLVLFKL